MLRPRFPNLLILASLAVVCLLISTQTLAQGTSPEMARVQDLPPAGCDVTLPAAGSFVPPSPTPLGLGANRFWFGTEKLWTSLPTDGTWRGHVPRKPGDSAYGNKFFLLRAYPGFSEGAWITITGKRLDGSTRPFTQRSYRYASDRAEDNAMTVGGISIPAYGCWKITVRYTEQELTFTAWVVPDRKAN
jgi:hypothetical protein